MRRAAVVLAAALVFTAPALGGSFSFGRAGAHNVLYKVTIDDRGTVTTTGPVHVRHHTLAPEKVVAVRRELELMKLTWLPNVRDCPGALRATQWSYVVLGGTVFLEHGTCSARLGQAWNALASVVGLIRR
jgi:hypothetical protein